MIFGSTYWLYNSLLLYLSLVWCTLFILSKSELLLIHCHVVFIVVVGVYLGVYLDVYCYYCLLFIVIYIFCYRCLWLWPLCCCFFFIVFFVCCFSLRRCRQLLFFRFLALPLLLSSGDGGYDDANIVVAGVFSFVVIVAFCCFCLVFVLLSLSSFFFFIVFVDSKFVIVRDQNIDKLDKLDFITPPWLFVHSEYLVRFVIVMIQAIVSWYFLCIAGYSFQFQAAVSWILFLRYCGLILLSRSNVQPITSWIFIFVFVVCYWVYV